MESKNESPWAWVIVAVVALQVVIPAIALAQPPPARFGFQMYSGYGEGSITAFDASGAEIDLDFNALLPRSLRPELDWAERVPQHFCAESSDIAVVVIEQNPRGRSVVPCE